MIDYRDGFIIFHRVEDSSSRDRYERGRGIVAQPRKDGPITLSPFRNTPEFYDTRDAVRNHGSLSNMTPTSLISAYEESLKAAEALADFRVREGRRKVVIHEIWIPKRRQHPLVEFRRLRGLREYLGLSIRRYMENEVVFLDRIPDEYIRSHQRFN